MYESFVAQNLMASAYVEPSQPSDRSNHLRAYFSSITWYSIDASLSDTSDLESFPRLIAL